jgi:hypothetical protein
MHYAPRATPPYSGYSSLCRHPLRAQRSQPFTFHFSPRSVALRARERREKRIARSACISNDEVQIIEKHSLCATPHALRLTRYAPRATPHALRPTRYALRATPPYSGYSSLCRHPLRAQRSQPFTFHQEVSPCGLGAESKAHSAERLARAFLER